MNSTTPPSGSAQRWGPLWGARPEAWAENEDQQTATYEQAIDRVGIQPAQRVLDVGCGSGAFLRLVADRGAQPFGLDASETLIEIARKRIPDADLRVGDLQFLPYEDDTFDVVTGLNSFFFAADMTEALGEAGRVAKAGAPVLIQVWGRSERCDLTTMLQAIRPLRPPPAQGVQPPVVFSEPGVLEGIAAEAGLTPRTAFDIGFSFEYPDEEALARRTLAAAPVIEAIQTSGEEAVRDAIVESLAPYRTSSGGYRLENEWHYLIATA
jgi:SAM-dependent methyltransferase